MEKEALTLSNARVLKGMGIGALGGAAAGAAGGAATAEEGKGLSGALKGALGGAAGGAALGAAGGWAVPRVQAGMKGGLTMGQSVKALGQDLRARALPAGKPAGTAAPTTPKPMPKAAPNPTMAANAQVGSYYQSLPESTRKMIEASPMVQQHGMSPQMAWQLQEMSRGKQSLGTFAAQANIPRPSVAVPAAGFGPAAATNAGAVGANAATSAGVRSVGQDAATAAQVRRPAVDAATVAPGIRKAAASYLLDKIHVEPKIRPLSAMPPQKVLIVKKAADEEGLSRADKMMLGGGATIVGERVARKPNRRLLERAFSEAHGPEDAALVEKLIDQADVPVGRATQVRTSHFKLPTAIAKHIPDADEVGKPMAEQIRYGLSGNAAYHPFAKRVYMGHGLEGNPAVLAHELGHARLDKGLGKLVQNIPGSLLARITVGGPGSKRPLAIGAASGALSGLTDDPELQAAGRWTPAALAGSMLASEAGASLIGLNKMRRAGASGKQLLRGVRDLAPAFGTYALPVVGSVGAAHLGQGAVLKARELAEDAEKQAMIPTAGSGLAMAQKNMQTAGQRLLKSQNIGVPKFKMPEPKPLNKIGFATSQYSGELGGGPIVYPSYIPPFKNPPVKTAGPPSEDEGKKKTSAMLDELALLNNFVLSDEMRKRANVTSPQSQLSKTERVGAPKATPPPGPSIQQVSKPVGFGRPIAAATKIGV